MGTYKNIVNSIEIEETVKEFDIRQKKSIKCFDEFISKISLRTKIKNLSFKSNSKKISDSKIDFEYENKKYNIIFFLIRNSGILDNNNKRFQIKKKIYLPNSINSYFGVLNIGEENLYFITEDLSSYITRYTKNSEEKSSSYSSYWINYKDLYNFLIINKNLDYFIDNKGIIFSKNMEILIDEYFKRTSENVIIQSNDKFNEIEDDDLFDFIDYFEEVNDFDWKNIKDIDFNNKLKRDSKIICDFLKNNQLCRGCSITSTFTKKNENIQYFEVHHFIPYNMKTQVNFKKSLDSKLNLVTLCPTCHRKIHLSSKEEQISLIQKIADKIVTKDFLKVYPEFKLEELIKIYENLYKKE